MDSSDPEILFDADGICDHCRSFDTHVAADWSPAGRPADLEEMGKSIRQHSRGEFDCILGLSGGLDSSYMAHVAVVDMGLRPLVFHVDGGWNSDVAVRNIEKVVDRLGLELFTEVINWNEMRDLQLAYFKSGVPHIDVPQDHAFVATLYNFCLEHGIRHILNGGNISTECVRNPLRFFYYGTDMLQFWDIHRQFGSVSLDTYPTSGILRHKLYLRYLRRIQVVKPLDLTGYIRDDAIAFMDDAYDYEYYGQKHFESRFTRFLESFWLPTRFGFDTRRVQLSSLILTGQTTREEALTILSRPPFDESAIDKDIDYVATKLGISVDELMGYHAAPKKFYYDYRNASSVFNLGARAMNRLGLERTIKR